MIRVTVDRNNDFTPVNSSFLFFLTATLSSFIGIIGFSAPTLRATDTKSPMF